MSEELRIIFELTQEDDWPPVAAETLWARREDDQSVVIDNPPFFVQGIAVGDAVEVESQPAGPPRFVSKLASGGHSTVQVIVLDDDLGPGLRETIRDAGCYVEGSPWPALFSIDLQSRDELLWLRELLDELVGQQRVEYKVACD